MFASSKSGKMAMLKFIQRNSQSLLYLVVLLFAELSATSPLPAKSIRPEVTEYPIPVVLANLRDYLKKPIATRKFSGAIVELQYARILSMEYASGRKTVDVRDDWNREEHIMYPVFDVDRPHMQFKITRSPQALRSVDSQIILSDALKHFQAALDIRPTLLAAKMGVGWCYIQMNKRQQAIKVLRDTFSAA